MPFTLRPLLVAAALGAPVIALAQDAAAADPWRFTVGLGAVARPEYPGSDQREVSPAPLISAARGRWVIGAAPGTGLPLGVAVHFVQTPAWRLGAVVGGNFAKTRKEEDDVRLAGLGDIDGTVRAGLFAAGTEGWFTARASVSADVGGQDQGTEVRMDIEARVPVSDQLAITLGPGATWANQRQQQTVFGISAEQSGRSGRAEYQPDAGLQSLRFSFGADYAITSAWGLSARAVLTSLRDDAGASPITQDTRQDSFALFATYRF